jgi:hypothetical protein
MRNLYYKVRDFLLRRKIAYIQVFNLENPHVELVLRDLAKFCRANETCFHPNENTMKALEGRREVWLRIQNHLHLTADQLCALYNPGVAPTATHNSGDE